MMSCLTSALFVLALGAPQALDARKELKVLQGDWRVVRLESKQGKEEPAASDAPVLTIKGKKWSIDGRQAAEITMLDPTTALKMMDIAEVRNGRPGQTSEAIYEIKGDTLKICFYQGQGKQRPTNFKTPTDEGTLLVVLRRVKK